MRKALIQDNFIQNGGAEKCVSSILDIWDDMDVFGLTDFMNDDDRQEILKGKKAQTSFIQNLPMAKKYFRHYLPFYPLAIEQLDLSEYDLIISSSYSVAKGVLSHAEQTHITYMHAPVRYAWDLYFHYLKEKKLNKGIKSIPVKWVLHYLRSWDVMSANRPDYYIANSQNIAKRIKKIYNKEATVIYPPVDTSAFYIGTKKEDYYITFSRMVPYKKIDIIVEAFSQMPDKKLIVCGKGPDMLRIKALATSNIEFLGYTPQKKLIETIQKAKAFVFAAYEDFGIAPVEAQACGVPVIAYGKGGVLETVKGKDYKRGEIFENDTGIFYSNQTPNDVKGAVLFFEKNQDKFDAQNIRNNALNFDTKIFKSEMSEFVQKVMGNK